MVTSKLLLLACCAGLATMQSVHAEVVRDGSLGSGDLTIGLVPVPDPEPNAPQSQYRIQQSMGETHGQNIFHSFNRFSVENGTKAVFEVNGNTANVISRVTGGVRSDLLGRVTLEAVVGDLGVVNFYLLNPAGVFLGANSNVRFTGGTTLSTEDAFTFADGERFFSSPREQSILTAASPAAFGILSNPLGDIEFEGVEADGSPASYLYNSINLRANNLYLYQGADIITQTNNGKKLNDYTTPSGDVTIRMLNNIELGTRGKDVNGVENAKSSFNSTIQVFGCTLATTCQDPASGNRGDTGDISLTTESGDIVLSNSSQLLTKVGNVDLDSNVDENAGIAAGDTGDILINAAGDFKTLQIEDPASSRPPALETINFGLGDAGKVSIIANNIVLDETIVQTNVGQPKDTTGTFTAGDIFLEATGSSTTADDSGLITLSGVEGNGIATAIRAVGSGSNVSSGDITLKSVNGIVLDNGASITVESFEDSQAGSINIDSTNFLTLKGSSDIVSAASNANGGDIRLNTRDFIVSDSQVLSEVIRGEGEAGNIAINADVAGILEGSKIRAGADQGAGGKIELDFDRYFVSLDSTISAKSNVQDGIIQLQGQSLGDDREKLNVEFLGEDTLLRKSCSNYNPENSLNVSGTNALSMTPDALFTLDYADDKTTALLQTLQKLPTQSARTRYLEDLAAKTDPRKQTLEYLPATRDPSAMQLYHLAIRQLANRQSLRGNYRAAIMNLRSLNSGEINAVSPLDTALNLNALGNNLIVEGKPGSAQTTFEAALEYTNATESLPLRAAILNNLANDYATRNMPRKALAAYRQSAEIYEKSGSEAALIKVYANIARVQARQGYAGDLRRMTSRLEKMLDATRRSQAKARVLLHLVRSHQIAQQNISWRATEISPLASIILHHFLNEAKAIAAAEDDAVLLAHALEQLGWLNQIERRPDKAIELTEAALVAAQGAQAKDASYRGYWQLGNLLWQQGKAAQAITAYRRAVAHMEELQQTNAGLHGSSFRYFQQNIAPVYLDLLNAALNTADHSDDPAVAQQLLLAARLTLAKYKNQEVESYFQDECVLNYRTKQQALENVSPTSVIVYPVLLNGRLEILASIPIAASKDPAKSAADSTATHWIKHYSVDIAAEDLTYDVEAFRRLLEGKVDAGGIQLAGEGQIKAAGKRLYQVLAAPVIDDIVPDKVETLVFAPDDVLRDIPFSALYNGKRYLFQDYAIATATTLSVVDPKADAAKTPNILLAGVSEAVDQQFGPLPWVPAELDFINSLYAGDVLLNKAFDIEAFAEKVKNNNYNIIHLASHAAFLGNPQDSFLLAYDKRISMNAFEDILSNTKYRENPLELLVLSACQSAAGNTMSSLGLAGVGIKAGARGAMGSLWYIDDKATAQLIRSFYSAMKNDEVSKAEALRRSQLALLESEEFSHPIFWSSMILVNNWI